MTFLDTNIFLRYLTKMRGQEEKAQACFALFQRVREGEAVVTTCEAVVCEIFFVLCSPRQYNLSHEDAVARVRPLLALGHWTQVKLGVGPVKTGAGSRFSALLSRPLTSASGCPLPQDRCHRTGERLVWGCRGADRAGGDAHWAL